jgi:hypothetical protein
MLSDFRVRYPKVRGSNPLHAYHHFKWSQVNCSFFPAVLGPRRLFADCSTPCCSFRRSRGYGVPAAHALSTLTRISVPPRVLPTAYFGIIGHSFRSTVDTHSGLFWTVIPVQNRQQILFELPFFNNKENLLF